MIARKGEGIRESFIVRRIVQGEGVERIFPLHSPKIAKIISKRKGITRRAKLYFLRDRIGKATKLREPQGNQQQDLPQTAVEQVGRGRDAGNGVMFAFS